MKPSYEQLLEQLKDALAKIDALEAEIQELKEKLNTNSSNSSKPPSQDPFRKRKKSKASKRRQGAQKGHKGHLRQLIPIEQVQKLHDLRPNLCPSCQSTSFDSEEIRTEVRQVVELPKAPPEVIQYNIHTCRCKGCRKHVKADIPYQAQYGFGPRLMGLVTTLSGEFRLSKRQVTALMGKIGIQISSGSVCKIHERASQILKDPYDEIKMHTLCQNHLNADETSWKTMTEKRWIWVGSSEHSVFFAIQATRSAQAFRNVFGAFQGSLTTDRYNAYNSHEGKRQLCWAHADRDFEKIAGRKGFDKWVGQGLLKCKEALFSLWHRFKDGEITRDDLIGEVEAGPKTQIATQTCL